MKPISHILSRFPSKIQMLLVLVLPVFLGLVVMAVAFEHHLARQVEAQSIREVRYKMLDIARTLELYSREDLPVDWFQRLIFNYSLDTRLNPILMADRNGKVIVSNRRKFIGNQLEFVEFGLPVSNEQFFAELIGEVIETGQVKIFRIENSNTLFFIGPGFYQVEGRVRPEFDLFILGKFDMRVSLNDAKRQLHKYIVLIVLVVFMVAGLLWWYGRWVWRRIDDIERCSEKFASGELSCRVNVYGQDEVARFTERFNQMLYNQEKLIAESKNEQVFLNGIINSIPDAVFVKDLDGRYLNCNPKFAQLVYKNSKTEIVGKRDCDFMSEERALVRNLSDKAILGHNYVTHREESFINQEGTEVFIDVYRAALVDANDELVGVVGICRDVTERVKSENELAQAKIKLEQVLKAIHVGVMLVDCENGCITDVNPAAARFFGRSANSMVNAKAWPFLAEKEEQDHSSIGDWLCEDEEAVLVGPDGELVTVLKTILIIEVNEKSYLLCSFSDITELKKMEIELRASLNESDLINQLTMGREHRVLELKEEVNQLCAKYGEIKRYETAGGGDNGI